jgi:hypothetical protein
MVNDGTLTPDDIRQHAQEILRMCQMILEENPFTSAQATRLQ